MVLLEKTFYEVVYQHDLLGGLLCTENTLEGFLPTDEYFRAYFIYTVPFQSSSKYDSFERFYGRFREQSVTYEQIRKSTMKYYRVVLCQPQEY